MSSADAQPPVSGPDFTLVLLDDDGRPQLALSPSSAPAGGDDGQPSGPAAAATSKRGFEQERAP